jgi:hypothetical protein
MTYNPIIPQPGDIPSQSQGQILTNFAQLNTIFANNHVAFNHAVVGARGMHNYVQLITQAVAPSVVGISGLYTLTPASPNLYWQRSGGAAVQMTGRDPLNAQSGYTFLPGGLLLQWGWTGAVLVPGLNSRVVVYPTPFAFCWSVNCSTITNAGTPSCSVFSVNNLNFTICNRENAAHDFYWMAIGRTL